MKNYMLETRIC